MKPYLPANSARMAARIKFQGATQTIFNAGSLGQFSDVSIAQAPGGKVQLLSPTRINGQLNLTNADSLLELNGQSLELDRHDYRRRQSEGRSDRKYGRW